MEDRHSVSEPRPVENNDSGGSMPSWEVDILRDDTVIVDTFLLNNDVLPPRTNKRGKVVWRLPDKVEKTPNFGTDDRRRILDIFKERKKKRKQEKKKRNLSPSQGGEPEPGSGKCERRDSSNTSPGKKGTGGTGGGGHAESANFERRDSRDNSPGEKGMNGVTTKAKHKGKENGKSSENLSKNIDGGAENGRGQKQKMKNNPVERGRGANRKLSPSETQLGIGKGQKQNKNTLKGETGRGTDGDSSSSGAQHSQMSLSPTPPQPPGLNASPEASFQGTNLSNQQIPSQHQRQSNATHLHRQVPSTPDPSRMSIDDSQESPKTPAPPQPQHFHQRPLSPQISILQSLPSDALFITVPHHERPQTLPGQPESSLAVPAARHFISKYYSHFDGTLPGAQIGDLIRYYTSKAQKSVSIGGAHSVVTGRRDIAAQILNLNGAAFVVRGVVAQDTADGKGVHILVTGTARTSLSGSPGGIVSNFAHSISLAPIAEGITKETYINDEQMRGEDICPALLVSLESGFPFQIHNDALALLSGDAGPVTPAPIIQPMQMPQQPPPPPPGLF